MAKKRQSRSDYDNLGLPPTEILRRFHSLMAEMPKPFSGADETPDPQPGQFWTARWNGLSTAVLLVNSPGPRTVSMAIVTFDPDLADDHAYVLPVEATDMNTVAVTWTEDAQRAPLAVLDTYLGLLKQDPGSTSSQDVAQCVAQVGERGLPVARPSDGRAVFRASLQDDLNALADASWLAASTDLSVVPRLSERSPSELARDLDISISEALGLKRGTNVPTEEQVEAWTQLQAADASLSLTHSAGLPDAVIEIFDQPRYRHKVARLAELRDLDENFARQKFAFSVLATAARKTGDDRSDEANRELWRQRVDQFFAVQFEDFGEEE